MLKSRLKLKASFSYLYPLETVDENNYTFVFKPFQIKIFLQLLKLQKSYGQGMMLAKCHTHL